MIVFAVFGAVAKLGFELQAVAEVTLQRTPELTVDVILQGNHCCFVEGRIRGFREGRKLDHTQLGSNGDFPSASAVDGPMQLGMSSRHDGPMRCSGLVA